MRHFYFPALPVVRLGLICFAAAWAASGATNPQVRLHVDWPKYLGQHDLVWERMPEDYFEGAFVGNGLFGAMVFKDDQQPNTLRFEMGRSDVYDHRTDGTRLGHAKIRLPIGQLLLTPRGTITQTELRTDLWNAEITGTLHTTEGTIALRCFVPKGEDVIVVNLKTTGHERAAACTFRPQQGDSQRYMLRPTRDKGFVFVPNPPFKTETVDGVSVTTQTLLAGSDYATAWSETPTAPDERTVLVTVANRFGSNPATPLGSTADAVKQLKIYERRSVAEMEQAHRRWWHAFYPVSFVSVPEARLESFYWIQLYKLASATRAEGPVIDLMGPWFKPSIWAALWMNLNVQLTYSTLGLTNHLDLEDPLYRLIEKHRAQLIANVPEKFRADCSAVANPVGWDELEAGVFLTDDPKSTQPMNLIVLPWLMQQFYTYNQRTMDEARLRESIYPLMRRTFNVYLRILHLGEDGRYHIPLTYSDEYGNAQDTSLNLALATWGFKTLIACAQRLNIDDPLLPQWRERLAKMADYPIDPATGIMIGKDVPFNKSHRHFSHLFALWPLRLIDPVAQPALSPLAAQSIRRFTDLEGDNCMFKYTGASSLWSSAGDGDQALRWIQRALLILPPQKKPVPTVGANTLYSENGWPTFESPISAARNVLDLLVQDGAGVIRVFPAMPSSWSDARFFGLRVEGAFLVSAVREAGVTRFIHVKSLAGEPCRIQATFPGTLRIEGSTTANLRQHNGLIKLDLKKGEEAILYSGEKPAAWLVEPLPLAPAEANRWGAKNPSKK